MLIVGVVIDAAEDSTQLHKHFDFFFDFVFVIGQASFGKLSHKLDYEESVCAFFEEDVRVAVSVVGVVFARWFAASGVPAVRGGFYVFVNPGCVFAGDLAHLLLSGVVEKVAEDEQLICDFGHRAGAEPVAFVLVIEAELVGGGEPVAGDESCFVVDKPVL
ncbi:hypothetical protein ES703_86729 [subsurface metagenome]